MAQRAQASDNTRSKRHSAHIDMTPMVDLAFLLLTFFVLTSTLRNPLAMKIQMPDKPDITVKQPEVTSERVLTLVLGESDKIYWYHGVINPKVELTNFSPTGIRKVLLEKNAAIKKMVLLVKPSDKSRYKNMVDILDEIDITNIQHYYLVDETPEDQQLISESNL
ncbi:MAG: biopolymer transporter ExbD [Chryseolinea sp.]